MLATAARASDSRGTAMHEMKDTARALVRIGFDGRVHKTYRGHRAKERYEHELRVLRHLDGRGCTFVPKVLECDAATLKMVTTNCGGRVDQLNEVRQKEIFAELEQYGVRHEDPALRNITYRTSDGRFCVIDFEFATLLDEQGREIASLKPSADA
jgi:tRNA A-37 threonylcarbamoyl transferase component Bud32